MRPSGATATQMGIPASVMKRAAWPCGVTRYTAPCVDATSRLPNASKARPCGVGDPGGEGRHHALAGDAHDAISAQVADEQVPRAPDGETPGPAEALGAH